MVGNGDVQMAEDALSLLRETGCDGVMIGRASVARPWIHWGSPPRSILPAPGDASTTSRQVTATPGRRVRDRAAPLHRRQRAHLRSRRRDQASQVPCTGAAAETDFGHELWRRMTNVRELRTRHAVTDDSSSPHRSAWRRGRRSRPEPRPYCGSASGSPPSSPAGSASVSGRLSAAACAAVSLVSRFGRRARGLTTRALVDVEQLDALRVRPATRMSATRMLDRRSAVGHRISRRPPTPASIPA